MWMQYQEGDIIWDTYTPVFKVSIKLSNTCIDQEGPAQETGSIWLSALW